MSMFKSAGEKAMSIKSRVELVRARIQHQTILKNLVQLYMYDFSVYFCDDQDEQIEADGRYDPGFDITAYLHGKTHWGYLGYVDGRLAGFSLVSDDVWRSDEPGRHLDEFFVLRCYRRRGVGRALAFQTLDTYHGYWEITEIEPNQPAIAFWRSVVNAYTHGRYTESADKAPGYGHVWQSFNSSIW